MLNQSLNTATAVVKRGGKCLMARPGVRCIVVVSLPELLVADFIRKGELG
jgi:hypothetical protein